MVRCCISDKKLHFRYKMSRQIAFRNVLSAWVLVCSLTLSACAQLSHPAGSDRPNIILILADDMGYGDPGCYNPDSRISTPVMDEMAREGMLFTNAHASSSVCTPSRYGILTGRYAWRSKLKSGVLWSYDWPLIEEGRTTLADWLRDWGYHTSIIGKWHLGWNWPVKEGARIDSLKWGGRSARQTLEREALIDFSRPLQGGPLSAGFDYQFGIDIPSLPPFAFIENGRVLGVQDTAASRAVNGYTQQGWKNEDMMPALLEKSIGRLRSQAGNQQPFFMFIPLTAPHTPIFPNAEFRGRSQAGDYGDFVSEVDAFLGRILAELKAQGIDDRTLVFFTSDNGAISAAGDRRLRNAEWAAFGSLIPLFGHNSNNGWRGMKGDLFEGGHRVPLLVRWPGKIAGGARSDALVSLTDIFATCAEILGHPVAAQDIAPDSYSFWGLLQGSSQPGGRTSMVAHSSYGNLSITRGNLKYLNCNHSGGNLKDAFKKEVDTVDTPGQLYNLSTDPGERHNLYRSRPAKVQELETLLNMIVGGERREDQ